MSLFWETVKMFAVLAIILTAAVYVIRFGATKLQPGTAPPGTYFKIIDRMMFTPKSGVILVKAGKEYYLLGVAEQSISLLKEMDPQALEQMAAKEGNEDFQRVLSQYQNGCNYMERMRARFFQQGGRNSEDR